MVKVPVELRIDQGLGVVGADELPGRHEETAGAAGGIADDVGGHGGRHLHHKLDDVPRRAELTILPGAGDFAEHVFIQISLRVAIGHGDVAEHLHHFGQ